jgi:tetratricopeptide (TPR) repeat protein
MRRLVTLAILLLTAAPLAGQRVKLLIPMDSLATRARNDSNDAIAHYDYSLALWLKKDYDTAERQLREAVAIEPSFAPGYLALSYLPYARRAKLWDEEDHGKIPAEWQPAVEEAWRFRRLAFLIDPMVDLKPVALMIAPAATFGLSGRATAVYTYLMNGFGSFWVGDYGTAYLFFKEMTQGSTEEQRGTFGSWFLWYEALAAAHTGEFDRAIADLRILLQRAERDQRMSGGASLAFSNANHYRYTLASVLDLSGRSQEAIPLLQEALTVDAGLYMGHARLASIYADQRRPAASIEERRLAIAANPDDASLLFDLGEALARAGQLPEAYRVLKQASDANPRNARALYVLGWVAQQLDSKPEARAAYEQFLQVAPSRFAGQKTEAAARLKTLQP